jgi:ankyrin repeat protein
MTESEAASQRRPSMLVAAVAAVALALVALAVPPWHVLPPIVLLPAWWLLLPLLAHAAAASLPSRSPAPGIGVRRTLAGAVWIWAHALLLAALLAPALRYLLAAPRLSAALLLAGAVVLALLLPWRLWPAPLLPEHDQPARAGERPGVGQLLRRSLRAACALTADRDLYLSHGLPTLLLHAVVLLAPAALLWAPARLGLPVLAPAALALVALAWGLYRHLHARVARLLLPIEPAEPTPAPARPIPDNALLRAAALRTALREGDVDHALALIAAGVDPVAPALPDEGDQRDALVIAATLNDSRPLRALIGAGADVNHRCQELTPLLAATRDSYYGRAEIVLALIANGARLDDVDGAGRSPLHHAALSAEPAVAAMLLDAGAGIDRIDADGWTALALACAAGNRPLVELLLERRAQTAPAGARPALCAVAGAADDDTALVALLLRARASVDATDPDGAAPLHLAAGAGHAGIAAALVAAGAAIDQRDRAGRTPLRLACAQFDPDSAIVAVLAAAGADASLADDDGISPASLQACWRGESGSRPDDLTTASGDPALALLATGQYGALRSWLLTASAPQRAGLALEAVQQGATRAMLDALAAPLGADPALPDGRDLVDAALDRLPASLPLLAALPAAGVSVAGGGRLARLLAGAGTEAAALEAVALAWLEAGADPFADPAGASALHHAAGRGLPALTARLLERGAHAGGADRDGVTPLHRALAHADDRALPLALLLLRHGADPEAAAGSGETPLGLANDGDRGAVVDWLRWRGWRLPRRKLGGHDLAAAARAGDATAVRRLLSLGLPINGRDSHGCTALIRAAGAGHTDVLEALLGQGADVAARTAGGMTALAAAAVAGHDGLVRRLLEHGVAVDQRCGNDATALVIAAACGALASVDHLLKAGARLDAVDGAGNTALHAAAGFAFGSADAGASRNLLLRLLGAGAEVDAVNAAGLTPLHVACGAAAVARANSAGIGAAFDVLLSRSQALALPDSHGCAPLHYAAAHGQLDAVRRLLARGVDPLRRDHGGWRPEDYANRYGWVEVAQALRMGPAAAAPLPQRPA